MISKLLGHRFFRFFIVGTSNAILHFSVLNATFYLLGAGRLIASIIATICALIYSFVLNRKFVFHSHDSNSARQVLLFVIVTLTGMLLIHNMVYMLTIIILTNREQVIIGAIRSITGVAVRSDFVDINISTIVGAIFALFWNYNGYRLFVFNAKNKKDDDEE
jgi:putative flippase GtrA